MEIVKQDTSVHLMLQVLLLHHVLKDSIVRKALRFLLLVLRVHSQPEEQNQLTNVVLVVQVSSALKVQRLKKDVQEVIIVLQTLLCLFHALAVLT